MLLAYLIIGRKVKSCLLFVHRAKYDHATIKQIYLEGCDTGDKDPQPEQQEGFSLLTLTVNISFLQRSMTHLLSSSGWGITLVMMSWQDVLPHRKLPWAQQDKCNNFVCKALPLSCLEAQVDRHLI